MVWNIVAGALGVIIITGGLFLRRLLGELKAQRLQLTEQRQQITGIERQLRRQRAHVTFLRQLLADNGEHDDEDGTPPQAAVVNGHEPDLPPNGPEPVRRKRHLGLYIGGAAAALAAFSGVVGEIARAHRGQLVGAVTGAAVTATTVSMVVIQPWSHEAQDSGFEFPHLSIPKVSIPPTYVPPDTLPPEPPPERRQPVPSATASSGSPTPSAGTPSASASPAPAGSLVPATDTSPPAATPTPSGQPSDDAGDSDGAAPPGPDPGTGGGTSPPPTASTAPEDPPTAADGLVCVDVTVPPLVDVDACLIEG